MQSFTMRRPIGLLAVIVGLVVLALAGIASAAERVVVTQNSAGWSQDDTRGGGTVSWTEEFGAPPGLGEGSLKLTTTINPGDKAGLYNHTMAGTPLADVDTLSYWTFQRAGNLPIAAASYQLQIDVNGLNTAGGFTTLVYEPYWNGVVAPETWQQWDVDAGLFWSSRAAVDGTCVLAPGAGGPPLYTLAQVQAMCPNAVVVGIGVNVGSNNPNYYVGVDGVQFNETIYDFELGRRPSSKDDCKNGGWQTFNDPAFRNQGECVSYANQNS
jgi:hypothetical protein